MKTLATLATVALALALAACDNKAPSTPGAPPTTCTPGTAGCPSK